MGLILAPVSRGGWGPSFVHLKNFEGPRASILNRRIYYDYYSCCCKSPGKEAVCLCILYVGRLCPHVWVRPLLTILFKWQPSPLPILFIPIPACHLLTYCVFYLSGLLFVHQGKARAGALAILYTAICPVPRTVPGPPWALCIYLLADEVQVWDPVLPQWL